MCNKPQVLSFIAVCYFNDLSDCLWPPFWGYHIHLSVDLITFLFKLCCQVYKLHDMFAISYRFDIKSLSPSGSEDDVGIKTAAEGSE